MQEHDPSREKTYPSIAVLEYSRLPREEPLTAGLILSYVPCSAAATYCAGVMCTYGIGTIA